MHQKKYNINFSKPKTKLCLSLYYNADYSQLFVNGEEIYKFKASNENNNFPSQFCLGSISYKFNFVLVLADTKKVSFKGNVYDFLVDSGAIDRSRFVNI